MSDQHKTRRPWFLVMRARWGFTVQSAMGIYGYRWYAHLGPRLVMFGPIRTACHDR